MRVVLIDGEGLIVKGEIKFERTSVNRVIACFMDRRGNQQRIELDMIVHIQED